MASNRPYRDALPPDKVLAEIERCSGTYFDPRLARLFLKSFGRSGPLRPVLAEVYARVGEMSTVAE
jgi:HD-GYP domain-containing protein (c-di-GMP phosphodiesterase class II)